MSSSEERRGSLSVHKSEKHKHEIIHHPNLDRPRTLWDRIRWMVMGNPKDLNDRSLFHRLSLIPFLAWVGLGADGLSSSAYGPEEAFRALAEHKSIALLIGLAMVVTILIISSAYRRIIEEFPSGGGGYLVASKLLGPSAGLVSGCALVVDYILTITVSVAAAGDALFSFIPLDYHSLKVPIEIFIILGMTIMNLRGVRESIMVLVPIFLLFVVNHLVLILLGLFGSPHGTAALQATTQGMGLSFESLGLIGFLGLFMHAYSLGGGTYTGIEAVSNGLPIMREPRVETGKRTMLYMSISLAVTATGLLLCYLFWDVVPEAGKTLNAVLTEKIVQSYPLGGNYFVTLTLFSEAMLLVVAAQAGFLDGPRVLASMALDHWVPRKFASLSERLVVSRGVTLMGLGSLIALILTQGKVSALVVMYSINVFITFSLSILGMLVGTLKKQNLSIRSKIKDLVIFAIGLALCSLILVMTVFEKFAQGGWLTVLITGIFILICIYIKQHYLMIARKFAPPVIRSISETELPNLILNPNAHTAAILVGGWGELGIETVRTLLRTFPNFYSNLVFLSVGVVDSGRFKGEESFEELRNDTQKMLEKYCDFSRQIGVASSYRMALGTDIVEEGALLCQLVAQEFPQITFFTGKLIFTEDRWIYRLLHNETGLSIQNRLQELGLTMVIFPTKL